MYFTNINQDPTGVQTKTDRSRKRLSPASAAVLSVGFSSQSDPGRTVAQNKHTHFTTQSPHALTSLLPVCTVCQYNHCVCVCHLVGSELLAGEWRILVKNIVAASSFWFDLRRAEVGALLRWLRTNKRQTGVIHSY